MELSSVKLSREGRVLIPSAVRAALGLVEGSTLSLRVEDGEIRLIDRAQALRRAQQIALRYKNSDESVVDQFLQERRVAAAQE